VRRLQSVRSGLFFAAFLPNIQIFGGEIVKNYPRWGHFSLRRLLPPRLLAWRKNPAVSFCAAFDEVDY
jgi:hypothetical protein